MACARGPFSKEHEGRHESAREMGRARMWLREYARSHSLSERVAGALGSRGRRPAVIAISRQARCPATAIIIITSEKSNAALRAAGAHLMRSTVI